MAAILFLLSLGAVVLALTIPGLTGIASAIAAAVLFSGAGIVNATDRAARKIATAVKEKAEARG